MRTKMKYIFGIIIVCNFISCSNEFSELTGTSWELVALVDEETGEQITPQCPQGDKWGEICYTFSFDKDGAGFLDLRCAEIYVDFFNPDIQFDAIGYICPESNFDVFYEMSKYIAKYKYENGELKFYCGNKKKYFLFKPLKERDISRVPVPEEILNLANTSWQLIGLADTETDELIIPCPDDCGEGTYDSFHFFKEEKGEGKLLLCCAEVYMNFSRNPVVGYKYNFHTCSEQAQTLLDMACTIDSCKYDDESKQLKLLCDNKKHYLLFNLIVK